MAISTDAKVDLLYKKYSGVTKTDLPANKSPSNEAIASPLIIRGDTIWAAASQIPTSAAAVATIVASYQTTSRIQCVADNTSTPIGGVYPSWKTNLIDWIPPEFGSTYFIKVYAAPAGTANPTSTTPLSDSGISSTGEWNFDYSSGVLNFIGGTIPAALTAANVIYITGYRYIGTKGVSTAGSFSGTFTGNVITDYISPDAAPVVTFTGNGAIALPVGTSDNRPIGVSGYLRYNSDVPSIEYHDGSTWIPVTNTVTDQIITGDGVTNTYILTQTASTVGILVSINGTLQQPSIAYSVVNSNQLVFTEVPLVTDIIDVRYLGAAVSINTSATISVVNVGLSTVIIDSWNSLTIRSAKYTISSSNAVDSQFAEIMSLQQNGVTKVNTFGVLLTGNNSVAFSSNISGTTVNILATGTTSGNQLKIQKTYFEI